MELIAESTGELTVIAVHAERIDAASAIRFKETMRELTAGGSGRVVLDLTSVDFIDSSGLGAIVSARKVLGEDRRMELAGLTPKVMKVFRLTRMDSVFTLHATIEEARRSDANAA